MLFISPAIRSAGRRFDRLRCRTERKSRSIAPWIAAAIGGSRVGTRDSRSTTVWAKPRSSRSSTLGGDLGAQLAEDHGRGLRVLALQEARERRRGPCRSAAPRPSAPRCGGGRRAAAAPRPRRRGPRRAACAPPWRRRRSPGRWSGARGTRTITASSTSWLILPRPLIARAKRSMSGSARSRRKPAASSGPMAVRIIAAFSIGVGIGSGAQRGGRSGFFGTRAVSRAASVMGRSSGPWRRRAGSSRRR